MKLYHWSSKTLAAHGNGNIIVMAENAEQARDKVYAQFDPLRDGNPFEDSYLQMLYNDSDEDYHTEHMRKFNVLREDLNKEPVVLISDVACLRGSD
jgi:hypothetical protein